MVCPAAIAPVAAVPVASQGQGRGAERPPPNGTHLVLDWDASVLHMSNYEATISSMACQRIWP